MCCTTVLAELTIGGMSSYTLILMVSAFINSCPKLPSLGHYLLAFLQFYGWHFASEHTVIVRGECMLRREEKAADELTIVDLFNPEVNAAAGVTKFAEVRELFRRTYEGIVQGDMREIAWQPVT